MRSTDLPLAMQGGLSQGTTTYFLATGYGG
jgi:hypothetical protein